MKADYPLLNLTLLARLLSRDVKTVRLWLRKSKVPASISAKQAYALLRSISEDREYGINSFED